MCGIVGSIGADIGAGLRALAHRGPDAQGMVRVGDLYLGHTRLAILDLDPRSNQPFAYGKVRLVFNGEIWNYQAVRAELVGLGQEFATTGDTEVVAAALDRWGPAALARFNGMFALAWTTDGETLHLARDRFGEIPLHLAQQRPFLFASELKALRALGAHPGSLADLGPGCYAEVTRRGVRQTRYYDPPARPVVIDRPEASQRLFALLEAAVQERAIAEVPVCTLLSGGIDSAAVAYLLQQQLPDLVAYTASLDPRSADLKSAKRTAAALGIKLRVIPVAAPTADDLARVIHHTEMPYKAQVEIGWACLQLAQAMPADGFKVTFSGEGSDELWASYGFAYHGLQNQDWHQYRKQLFLDQARKNFPRCNKVFMAHGIECRLPFLHPTVVEFALALPRQAVQEGTRRPKAVLQDAFRGQLPDHVTRRPKVAFQDGLGLKAAIASTLPDPRRFYDAEYRNQFGQQSRAPARGQVGLRRGGHAHLR